VLLVYFYFFYYRFITWSILTLFGIDNCFLTLVSVYSCGTNGKNLQIGVIFPKLYRFLKIYIYGIRWFFMTTLLRESDVL